MSTKDATWSGRDFSSIQKRRLNSGLLNECFLELMGLVMMTNQLRRKIKNSYSRPSRRNLTRNE